MTGSVQNVGEGAVEGVGVTIELVGEGGKTVASAFGQLSADVLAPGEKATFTAQLDTEATAQNVRVMPRWRAREKEGDETDPASARRQGRRGEGSDPSRRADSRPHAGPGRHAGSCPAVARHGGAAGERAGRRAVAAGRRVRAPAVLQPAEAAGRRLSRGRPGPGWPPRSSSSRTGNRSGRCSPRRWPARGTASRRSRPATRRSAGSPRGGATPSS